MHTFGNHSAFSSCSRFFRFDLVGPGWSVESVDKELLDIIGVFGRDIFAFIPAPNSLNIRLNPDISGARFGTLSMLYRD